MKLFILFLMKGKALIRNCNALIYSAVISVKSKIFGYHSSVEPLTLFGGYLYWIARMGYLVIIYKNILIITFLLTVNNIYANIKI